MISQRERGELARFYTVTEPKRHKKGYTVYKVTARIISRRNPEDVQEITVWKRYSDFRKLHQDLWQIHRSLYQQPELFPPFAKAKVFGRFDQSVIEERRQCSEDLLQFSANIPALYSSQYIEDFFKGGEVHDGSELIGPPEPLSDFLADSWSDCSSEVQKDVGGADESTTASHSEYGGVSSDSDLISLLLDTDSLADVDDGMASDGDSPNRPPRGVSPSPLPSLPDDCQDAEVSRASRAALFPSALRSRAGKKDYLERASEQIRQAVQREGEQDYQAAFSFYRSGVDLLLQGVQGDPSPTRREAVKKKTAEYLMRAEQISTQYLRDGSEPGPVPSLALGALGSRPTWKQRNPAEELKVFRVLGVIDKVLLVMDKRSQETFILKGLRKSSECGGNKKTVIPRCVPNMVCLHKYIVSEDAVFLVLQHAEGGKLWSHIGKFLNKSPEDSLDIPFIQKSHTTAVHTVECPVPEELSSGSVDSGPNREGVTLGVLPLKSSLTPSSQDDSSTQDEEGADSSQRVLLDSGATSEEECTNSYLALCNEYEQEKIEPDSLEEGPTPVAEETASHSQPLLSSDSLGSPSMAQEFCFFTEDDHSEVFSPSRFPANPLDQSKKTPMELFRIDSRDSASELLGMDSGDRLRFEPSKPDLEEVTEVIGKGPQMDLWGFDSDRGSNESVPVISFKEAIVDDTGSCDEGRPPDLLVNLPGVADSSAEELVSAGASSTDDARMSPGFGKPDVLQLHYDLGHDAVLGLSEDEGDPSSVCTEPTYMGDGAAARGGRPLSSSPHEYGGPPSSPGFRKALATFSEELPAVHGGFHAAPEVARSELRSERETHDRIAAEALGDSASVEVDAGKVDSDVSQLFKDLDDLLLIASNVHLPEEHVQRWAVQMIVALDALHQEGIICRDLNPNNILLDDRGHIQLTYFCSWSEVEDSYDQEAVSAMYCAPEVGSISEETAACDWWSLGAILFELLTGKSLRQCHPAGISRHTMLNVPDFVSEEAKSLLQQLLQFNPVERLGAGVAGVEDIKSHPFFATVIWPK